MHSEGYCTWLPNKYQRHSVLPKKVLIARHSVLPKKVLIARHSVLPKKVLIARHSVLPKKVPIDAASPCWSKNWQHHASVTTWGVANFPRMRIGIARKTCSYSTFTLRMYFAIRWKWGVFCSPIETTLSIHQMNGLLKFYKWLQFTKHRMTELCGKSNMHSQHEWTIVHMSRGFAL